MYPIRQPSSLWEKSSSLTIQKSCSPCREISVLKIILQEGLDDMRNQFDRQLKKLNEELFEMGSMIEKSIEKAVVALLTQDVEKAKKVIEFDREIDRQEREIEGLCMKLLLQQQPVARDLRLISAALKMITDMERIGDQAEDIAELAIQMSGQPYIKDLKHISRMGKETIQMVIDCVDAFVEKDLDKARKVLAQDDVVDSLFVEVKFAKE